MNNKILFLKLVVFSLSLTILSCAHPVKDQPTIDGFVKQMAVKHRFDDAALTKLFDQVSISEEILIKIAKPAEGLPWYKYRRIFLKQPRIKAGVEFWQKNAATLANVEQETGVPAAIIVAIIGVETQYGQHTGNHKVIDALSTLAFAYPPRSAFFRNELEHFLLLCREEKINPLIPTGSYAGAMGIPQFMPSSFRLYAIDFNKNSRRDIWQDPEDVIASVGHYFVKHGWQKGQAVAFQVRDGVHKSAQNAPLLKQNLRFLKSNASNPNISKPLLSTNKAKIIALKQENGEESWAALNNFYVITRYNKSPLYAMAVYQLSLAISNLRTSTSYEKDFNSATRPGLVQLFDKPD